MSKVGTIAWRELNTSEPERSERFYGELFGWSIRSVPHGPGTYRLLYAGEKQIGGIFHVDKPNVPPHWASYVEVDDVDAACARVKSAGGSNATAVMDIPNVGRFAAVLDGDHAVSVAFKSAHPSNEVPASAGTGDFVWEQLNAPSPEKSVAFYTQVYGWKPRVHEADPRLTIMSASGTDVCTIMQAPPGMPAHWLTYVTVDKLVETNARARKLGGKVIVEEIPIEGFGALSVIEDDLGATIGTFEAR